MPPNDPAREALDDLRDAVEDARAVLMNLALPKDRALWVQNEEFFLEWDLSAHAYGLMGAIIRAKAAGMERRALQEWPIKERLVFCRMLPRLLELAHAEGSLEIRAAREAARMIREALD